MSDVTIPEDIWVLVQGLPLVSENFDDGDLEVVARAILAERDRGQKALDEANRRATDLRYMRDAYWTMLGPIGLKVAAMWTEQRVKRVHHSWGPEAHNLTGEERAEYILQLSAQIGQLK